jgi:hydrogenase maturation protease
MSDPAEAEREPGREPGAGGEPAIPGGEPGRRPVHLLVCGESLRGDDGAAIRAAELLPAGIRELAFVREVGQLEVEALLDVPDYGAVIVADAAVGVAPGRVVVLDLAAVARSASGGAVPASSHSLAPEQVLALADQLRGSRLRGSFVGIGASGFGFGEGLSDEVAAGLPEFAATIASEVRRLAAD